MVHNAPSQPDGIRPASLPVFTRLSVAADWQAPVARRNHDIVSELEFRRRVRAWTNTLHTVSNPAIALFEPDGVEFAAALIGAWYADKVVYLPGDALPATCRAIHQHDVRFVGAVADEWQPLRATDDGEASAPFAPLDATVVRVVIYTSGSTGAPQAVPKQLRQLLAEVDTLESTFGNQLGPAEVLATVSHQHIYGLLFKILWPLMHRRVFVAVSAQYPEDIVAHLTARRTAVVSGPAHLRRLPPSLNWSDAQRGACVVFSSGGPLPTDAVLDTETALATTPIEVYGSSETGGIAWRQRVGGVELPWTPFAAVMVRSDDGCLAIRSPNLADAQWHQVPDRVRFTDERRFVLAGRTDRIAKVEGKRVSLAGIEGALLLSGVVAECRVVLLESGRDELGAVIVPNDHGWTLMRDGGMPAIRKHVETTLGDSVERIASPRRWRWVDALPVNAIGKTSNADVAQLFEPHALRMPAAHCLDDGADRARYEIYVSPHLVVFSGHFTNLPVLPGVAQIEWAMLYGRAQFAIGGAFARLEAVKFQRLYQPGRLLSLDMEWHADRAMLSFRFASSAGSHSSGRVFFAT